MESHQEIGKRLELFFIDEVSPGSIFWKPRGTILFNNLIKLIRDLYDQYGYSEVVTPNICEKKLWETSGHWDKYRENMFILKDIHHRDCEKDSVESQSPDLLSDEKKEDQHQVFACKAMNCPLHCLIFKNMRPYSRDLPIRLAEFGVLHRNEASGALHGLTRVRRFQQDDAHIFCRLDQVHQEVLNNLKMIEKVYNLFDLKFTIKLSTRPEKFIGSVEVWDNAEKILEDVIKDFTGKSKIKKNDGDGAFYGPKIDITLIDKYGRSVQCGTIQLDFNLPSEERFNLRYIDEHDHSHHHPVIVHRAVLGSVERFIGIILEHTQGRLPIQVSPYPIIIVTIHKDFNNSAVQLKEHIQTTLKKHNVKMSIDLDISSEDIKNKIKSAEKKGYNYIVTVGKDEVASILLGIDNATVAVRSNKKVSSYKVCDILNEIESLLKIE